MDLNAVSNMKNLLDQTKSSGSFESASKREQEMDIDIDDSSIQVTKREDQNRSSCCGEERDDEVSLQDFALAIDHIFEYVLSDLDPATLFECRLVSHRWSQMSTKVLKKGETCISFRDQMDSFFTAPPEGDQASLRRRTVPKLISFLKENYYTHPAGPFNMSTFPCNSLVFSGFLGLSDPDLQTLINLYGEQVRHFSIHCSSTSEATSESRFIQQVEHLLVTQAPNLQTISLHGVKLTEQTVIDQSTNRAASVSVLEPIKKATKLKAITVEGVSRKVIDSIVAISPNLSKIQVAAEDFHLLAEPTNLLHYLKEFEFDSSGFDQNNLADFELLEAAILLTPQERQLQNLPPMKCKSLCVTFDDMVDYLDSHEHVRLRFVRMINKILESSWDTLEFVDFYRHTEKTLKGLRWPRVLPKVRWLTSEPTQSCGLEIFPLDGTFTIPGTFPRLQNFNLTVVYENIRDSSDADFLRKRNLGPLTSRTAVAVVIIIESESAYYRDNIWDEEELLDYYSECLLYKLCPDVDVELSCVYL